MNLLDRVVAWWSPERGLRRATARDLLETMTRQGYDGARSGRRTDGWRAAGTSANAEIIGALPKLLARSRDLCRNDPHIVSARRAVREYAVGTGIELHLSDRRWQALWDEWVKQADAEGVLSFHALQSLAAGTIFESGSVLLRRRPRRPEDGLVVPLQIQALEPDVLDAMRDNARDSGGWIQGGIEFDPVGRRRGYWIFPVHPGETSALYMRRGATLESRFVSALDVSHVFVAERPGQLTGVPWAAPVIIKARDLADYDDAELFRKKLEACIVGFVSQAGGVMGQPLGPRPGSAPSAAGQDGTQRPEVFEPGTYVYGRPGESITFNDPKGSTAYGPYVRTQKEALGAGIGVPYARLTGDLSQANYSSLKAGGNQFEQAMDVFRWLTLIPRICEPVLQWFYEAAELAGVAPGRRPEHEWQAPPYPEVDPLKAATSRVIDIRAGVVTPQEVLRSRGTDPRNVLEQIAEWNKQLDELGVVLDTDPRKVSRSGVGQTADPTMVGDGNGDSTDSNAE